MTSSALVVEAGEGTPIWFLGTLTTIKQIGEAQGSSTVMEILMPAGAATPLHVHHDEDDSFYLLDGELTMSCGDEHRRIHPGDYVSMPKDVPHALRVEGDVPARLLVVHTTNRFAQFVEDLGEPAASRALPSTVPDITPERFAVAVERAHQDILGPAPGSAQ